MGHHAAGRMAVITENAKSRTVQHLAAHVQEAARRWAKQQSQAMTDAARVAFGAELGPTLRRVQSALQPLVEGLEGRRERSLTPFAAAAAVAATWVLVLRLAGG
jgi:hypothetical protein